MNETKMKTIGLVLVSFSLFSTFSVWATVELPPGVSQRLYCETCLATVQGLRKSLLGPPNEPSRAKIKAQIGNVCETLTLEEQGFAAADKALAACKHLLDLHGEKFEETFLMEKDVTLETNLCYIYTTACTGVKRNHFQGQEFHDAVIEELLEKHKGKLRVSKPMTTESSPNQKEEL